MSWAIRSPSCSHSRISRASWIAPGSPSAGRAAAARSAGRCGRTPRTGRAAPGRASASPATCGRTLGARARTERRVHNSFTSRSPAGNRRARRARQPPVGDGADSIARCCGPAIWRSARRTARVVGGAPCPSRCASSSCWRRWCAARAVVPREELYETVVGRTAARARPLRRRVRPQAAVEAGPRAPGVRASSTRTSGSATGWSRSLHTLFTRAVNNQDKDGVR